MIIPKPPIKKTMIILELRLSYLYDCSRLDMMILGPPLTQQFHEEGWGRGVVGEGEGGCGLNLNKLEICRRKQYYFLR